MKCEVVLWKNRYLHCNGMLSLKKCADYGVGIFYH
jgi:hypothetical protein